MRRALTAPLLVVVVLLALAGCSGSATSGSTSAPGGATGPAASPSSSTPDAASTGSVDCAGLTKEDLASYIVYTQVIAQVRDNDAVQALKQHSFTDYTPAKFAAILAKLQVLAGHPATGFGDPADSLAYYAKVNDIVTRMLATSGDVPQELLDEYAGAVGDTTSSLSKQLAINAALSQYCPST